MGYVFSVSFVSCMVYVRQFLSFVYLVRFFIPLVRSSFRSFVFFCLISFVIYTCRRSFVPSFFSSSFLYCVRSFFRYFAMLFRSFVRSFVFVCFIPDFVRSLFLYLCISSFRYFFSYVVRSLVFSDCCRSVFIYFVSS